MTQPQEHKTNKEWEKAEIEIKKMIASILGFVVSGVRDTGQARLLEIKLEALLKFVDILVSSIAKSETSHKTKIAEVLRGSLKMQTKHFSDGIEVEHHGQRLCTDACVLNGKEQSGQHNQTLKDVASKLGIDLEK